MSISSKRNDSCGSRAIRLCIITTVGKSIQVLYEGRIEYLVAHGFEVTAACSSSELDDAIRARGVRFHGFPLTRAVTPFADVRALLQMYRFFRREKFDLIEVATPKAALLGSIAAWLARCPCVIHIAHGLAYEGKRGLLGWSLRMSVKVPCRLAHITFAVSPSVRQEIIANGLGSADGIRVIGAGSANGIDPSRYSSERREERRSVRETHQIPPDAVVLGFIGRLVRDKGVEELAEAFRELRRQFPQAILILVGEYEHRDKPSQACVDFFAKDPGVRAVGWQNNVLPFLAGMDIFVLPTYREGLGIVLLEAAAMGLPTVTTNATGARDAMVDGITGIRVPIGDSGALRKAIARLIRDPALRESMGRAGREWVCANFEQAEVWKQWEAEYRNFVCHKGM